MEERRGGGKGYRGKESEGERGRGKDIEGMRERGRWRGEGEIRVIQKAVTDSIII